MEKREISDRRDVIHTEETLTEDPKGDRKETEEGLMAGEGEGRRKRGLIATRQDDLRVARAGQCGAIETFKTAEESSDLFTLCRTEAATFKPFEISRLARREDPEGDLIKERLFFEGFIGDEACGGLKGKERHERLCLFLSPIWTESVADG